MESMALPRQRIQSLDILRGLVMIVMALDHTRDYFHIGSFSTDPTDLTQTTASLFFTRWITHFCAPVFMLLAGTSAFLSGQRKTKKELTRFLLTRGLWLILLEISIISFGWSFELDFSHLTLAVIWALGASMLVLAGLLWLPLPVLTGMGLLLIFAHNTLDAIHVQGNNPTALGWKLLHDMGGVTLGPVHFFVMYPILPWIGVMTLGYALGHLYQKNFDPALRKKILLRLGLAAIFLFVALRFTNWYGDMDPWSTQANSAFTYLSFLNTHKYPPSLLYLAMTLGPALLFLAFTESLSGPLSSIIRVFGRVPMFYYILHLYLIHGSALVMAYLQGFSAPDFADGIPKGYGLNLGLTYLVWFGVVLLLYPLCRRYDRYKSSHPEKKWLSYI